LRILQDLSFVNLGYSGIPCDTRTSLKMLADLEGVEVEGLLVAWPRPVPGRTACGAASLRPLVAAGSIIGAAAAAQHSVEKRARLFGVNQITKGLLRLSMMATRSHWRVELPLGELGDAIWRVYFTVRCRGRRTVRSCRGAFTSPISTGRE
jgi:hypothetical protein